MGYLQFLAQLTCVVVSIAVLVVVDKRGHTLYSYTSRSEKPRIRTSVRTYADIRAAFVEVFGLEIGPLNPLRKVGLEAHALQYIYVIVVNLANVEEVMPQYY